MNPSVAAWTWNGLAKSDPLNVTEPSAPQPNTAVAPAMAVWIALPVKRVPALTVLTAGVTVTGLPELM